MIKLLPSARILTEISSPEITSFLIETQPFSVARNGTGRGTKWHGCGTKWHGRLNQLKTNTIPSGTVENATERYSANKIRNLGPFCSVLRRVCPFTRPEWATPCLHRPGPGPCFQIRRSNLGPLAAASVSIFVSLVSPSLAQEWKPVSSQTSWTATSSFVREFSQSVTTQARPLAGTHKLDQLLSLIALAEANREYDSVNTGARIKPPAPPTSMTIAQIYGWIDRTPGQPHAIGRYQFIPDTLRDLVRQLGVSHSAKFDARLQDRLGLALVAQAGYQDFAAGRISASRFQDNLAMIWAGLPIANGRSYYHGYAGNRATITRARYNALFLGIFG